MIRQEIVVCQKCGSLKEMSDDCECEDGEDKPGYFSLSGVIQPIPSSNPQGIQ